MKFIWILCLTILPVSLASAQWWPDETDDHFCQDYLVNKSCEKLENGNFAIYRLHWYDSGEGNVCINKEFSIEYTSRLNCKVTLALQNWSSIDRCQREIQHICKADESGDWRVYTSSKDSRLSCMLDVEEVPSAVFLSYADCLDFIEFEAK